MKFVVLLSKYLNIYYACETLGSSKQNVETYLNRLFAGGLDNWSWVLVLRAKQTDESHGR